jgi:hypothetical protein
LNTTLVLGLLLANGYPSVHPQGMAGTFAESFAVTVPPPEFPDAVATLVVVVEMVNVCVRVAQAAGASGPHVPTVTSSDVRPGVPASSTSVPDAGKNLPVLQMTYVYRTGVGTPSWIWFTPGVLVSEIERS